MVLSSYDAFVDIDFSLQDVSKIIVGMRLRYAGSFQASKHKSLFNHILESEFAVDLLDSVEQMMVEKLFL